MLRSLLSNRSTEKTAVHHIARSGQATGPTVIHQPQAGPSETPRQAQALPGLDLQLELVEETISRRRLLLGSAKTPANADETTEPSSSNNSMVFIDLATLGLESVVPADSKDYTVAAIKLATSSRAREAALHEIDTTLETLRAQVARYNEANEDVTFSSGLYDSVKARYRLTPKVGEFMETLVNTLIPRKCQTA
ncbi:hypothetical protein BKA70DRAFT_1238171 [Coprinopsis sp. MPI-PUGE-AT-0042]|nr:hypothetical protein BKA70DRAFT_1238171 [Coprinopsis sp. MPI-PUGE-AT-0042]